MTLTESGLRYMIYKQGPAGELAKTGQTASIRVRVETLDRVVRYETEKETVEAFAIDKSEKETGEVAYLKAIIASRNGESVDVILNHLNTAFSLDSNLKTKAAKDREFVKHFSNSTFSSAVR
jgi:hypothetical protein